MKTGLKRILCLLCAMCMFVFALTACGGKDDKDTNTSSQGSNAGASTNETVSFNTPDIEPGSVWENFDPYATISDSF